MSKFFRKLKRKKKAADKKILKSMIKGVEEKFNTVPESCTSCGAIFNLVKDADSWMIEQSPSRSLKLLCPECFEQEKTNDNC